MKQEKEKEKGSSMGMFKFKISIKGDYIGFEIEGSTVYTLKHL